MTGIRQTGRYARALGASLLLAAGCSDAAGPERQSPVVRVVYLVPANRGEDLSYATGMANAMRHLQRWYFDALATGGTFTLTDPVVSVHRSSHTADWYATTPNGDPVRAFFNNVADDGLAIVGGRANDPATVWVFFVDADHACGQAGAAGTSGIAVFTASYLRRFVGRATAAACVDDPIASCPAVGAVGHELGHAFGLHHPAACEAGTAGCPTNALLWLGYTTYPQAALTTEDKTALGASAFFRMTSPSPAAFGCSNLLAPAIGAGLGRAFALATPLPAPAC
ncbi:MAG: hypothetical protein WKG32_11575 [Gemmatimonadaceae bacterium]